MTMVVFAYFSGYLDWHAAREACIARGGDLASIQSAADNAAAITLIAGASTTWMGYRCGAKGSCGALDHWNWVDGSPAAYNNWDPNEEHSRPSDACGHFKDTGTWGSLACTGLPELVDGYLCSLPSASQARRHLQIASPPKVIQIGDSWTELSLQTQATFCRGATTVNRGVSSSKAIEWAQGSACPLSSRDRSCSMTEAFSPAHGSGYTHAVLTAGGNDFLDYPGCSMTEANVQSRVTDAINTLRAAAPPAPSTRRCRPIASPSACDRAGGCAWRRRGRVLHHQVSAAPSGRWCYPTASLWARDLEGAASTRRMNGTPVKKLLNRGAASRRLAVVRFLP